MKPMKIIVTQVAENWRAAASDPAVLVMGNGAPDVPMPMGGWNLTAEQAANDSLLRRIAADAYPAYSEFEIVRQ